MSIRKQEIENQVKRIRQFNINDELVGELEFFLNETNLTDDQISKLCSLIERITTQHYVKQLLKTELR